jgi:UDP-2-acetamido-3-amino-2,3-dideoxy-glucuronate N-acetyltransferase
VLIWHGALVRAGASLGDQCIVGKDVYIDVGVRIGMRCKIQNQSCLYGNCTLHDGVFIGPGAIVANDRHPRAINPDGSLKVASDWIRGSTTIEEGASVGAGAVVHPGITIGRWAMVGSLSAVTKDVPAHGLVVGVPGRLIGYVCLCGRICADACGVCGWRPSD